MKIYKPDAVQITVGGTIYVADSDGIIDVPDAKVNHNIWAQGFVDAKAKMAQLAQEQAVPEMAAGSKPEPEPAPASAPISVAAPNTASVADNKPATSASASVPAAAKSTIEPPAAAITPVGAGDTKSASKGNNQ